MAKNGRLYATDVTLASQNQVWIRFGLAVPSDSVSVVINQGGSTKTIILGNLRAGRFADRGQALFWNKRDNAGDLFSSGETSVSLFVDSVLQDKKKFNL